MKHNWFAAKTLHYIWHHPNCRQSRGQAILRFLGWQFYKRLTGRYLDFSLLPNLKVRCYPDSQATSAALYCGLYDYHEMHFLLRYLRPADSFLDIGANVGIYTLLAASRIHLGTIYSFEALPKNYDRLQDNLALNQITRAKTWAIAIADQIGEMPLVLLDGDALPFLSKSHSANGQTLTVPTATLDSILADQAVDTLMLGKMDIEGAELLALKGAINLLQQNRPPVWILEINDGVNHFGHNKQDVVIFLQDYGYELYRYDADTNKLFPLMLEAHQGNNVLAIAQTALETVKTRLTTQAISSCQIPLAGDRHNHRRWWRPR
jgi:FkbM family methyltransferase